MRIRSMRPDEISIAVDWAAAEGWNPGLADATCFSSVDPDGLPKTRSCRHSLALLQLTIRSVRTPRRAAN
jgi:hypothetical protein